MKYAKLIGVGSFLPDRVLSNHDLEKTLDTSDDWIVSRTGIKRRHIVSNGETVLSMAEQASRRALEFADIDGSALDGIIVATCTPDNIFPSVACGLQRCLGVKNGFAFSVSAACSGFIYALTTAEQYIRSNMATRILVVGSEAMSKVVDWSDRETCVLFGDGAGAVVLEASNTPGIIGSKLDANGDFHDVLYLPNDIYEVDGKIPDKYIKMRGKEVFRLAVTAMVDSVNQLLADHGIEISEIDCLVPHQANYRIIEMIRNKLNLSKEQVILTLDEHANTSSASVPLALDYGIRNGVICKGQTILLEAFGGGLTWGSVLLKY